MPASQAENRSGKAPAENFAACLKYGKSSRFWSPFNQDSATLL
jgi:hypothetical protein